MSNKRWWWGYSNRWKSNKCGDRVIQAGEGVIRGGDGVIRASEGVIRAGQDF